MGVVIATQLGIPNYGNNIGEQLANNPLLLDLVSKGDKTSRKAIVKVIKQECCFEKLEEHTLRKNVLHRLVQCLAGITAAQWNDPEKMRRKMVQYQFQLPYSLVMTVLYVILEMLKRLDKKLTNQSSRSGSSNKYKEKYHRYKALYKETLDAIEMLAKWSRDMVVVGSCAELGYESYMTRVMMSKLNPRKSGSTWMGLYSEHGQFFNQAAEIGGRAARRGNGVVDIVAGTSMDNSSVSNSVSKVRKKSHGGPYFGNICRFYQAGKCDKGARGRGCKCKHIYGWCFKFDHGMKNCPDFLDSAGLKRVKKDSESKT